MQRLVFIITTALILFGLAVPVLAQQGCLPEGQKKSYTTCKQVTCCDGLVCKDDVEYKISGRGAGTTTLEINTATCVAAATIQKECLPDGGTSHASCTDVVCCPGLSCVEIEPPPAYSSNPLESVVSGWVGSALGYTQCFKPKAGTEPPPVQPGGEGTKPVIFKPQVTIPGNITIGGKEISFRQGEGMPVTGDTLAQYIGVFYKFFIAMLAVVSVVMVMWGGFKRILAAGVAETIKNANETIFGALAGLILALVSYSLLNLINPKLVTLGTLDINEIKKEEIDWETDEQLVSQPKPALVRLTPATNLAMDGSYIEVDSSLKDPLLQAKSDLEGKGYGMHITSAYRDIEKQKALIKLNCQNPPGWAVCNPLPGRPVTCMLANGATSCPHTAGRAVDIWATKSGSLCIQPPGGKTLTGYCSGKSKQQCLDDQCQRALIEAMRKQGFCVLCAEPWHFERPRMSSCCT